MIKANNDTVLYELLSKLRSIWEETNHQLELLQTNKRCAEEQKKWISEAKNPAYVAKFDFTSRRIDFDDPKKLSKLHCPMPSKAFLLLLFLFISSFIRFKLVLV